MVASKKIVCNVLVDGKVRLIYFTEAQYAEIIDQRWITKLRRKLRRFIFIICGSIKR